MKRYHIVDDGGKVTEIGETYHKYGRKPDDEEEDFPPPWQDMAEISQVISSSTSFAEAFLETNKEGGQVEDIEAEDVVNLTEEAKKSTSFAELISKTIIDDDQSEG